MVEDTMISTFQKEKLLSRITVNPKIMVGKPIIRGMRITVEQLVKAVAAGIPLNALQSDYPELEKEDITAALLYAAQVVEAEKVYPIAS